MENEIKKFKFKLSAKLKVEVVPLETLTTANRPHLTTHHRTDFYHIFLFEDCSPTHLVDFNPVKIKKDSLLFINKDSVHRFDKTANYKGKCLIFTDDFFCVTDSDRKFLHSSVLFNDLHSITTIPLEKSNQYFADNIAVMEKELGAKPDTYQRNILHNLLHIFLLYAERLRHRQGFNELKKGPDFDYTILFRDLLDGHFQKEKSVSAYAELMAISEKRLNHATTNALGKTPKQMIDDKILLEAKRLLAHSSQSVKEIAVSLGYDEPTYFIRYFKKHLSQTPVEFREHCTY